MRLGDDLVAYPVISRAGQHRVQQRPRIGLRQAPDRQLRQPRQVAAPGTGAEHQAHQRRVRGRLRQQAQHGQADQEPVRRRGPQRG